MSVLVIIVVMFCAMTGLMELIHKAAFRDTLGRSLYMDENRVGSFTPENVNSLSFLRYFDKLLLFLLFCLECNSDVGFGQTEQ